MNRCHLLEATRVTAYPEKCIFPVKGHNSASQPACLPIPYLLNTRQWVIGVVPRLSKMSPKSLGLKVLTNTLLIHAKRENICAMLGCSHDLLCSSSQSGLRRLLRPGQNSRDDTSKLQRYFDFHSARTSSTT